MKKLIFGNTEYEAEKIIKTETDIIGYVGNKEVFAFRTIKDFSGFILDEGFDISEPTDKERIEALESALLEVVLGG
jgi:hypothetical protein